MKKFVIYFIWFIFIFLNQAFAQSSSWSKIDSVRYYTHDSTISGAYFFSAISCFNSENCIAIGNMYGSSPWNRYTSNGGKSWSTTLIDTFKFDKQTSSYYYPSPAIRVSYPNDKQCFITCDSGFYWKSVDNCKNWKRGKINVKANYPLKNIFFFNENIGAIVDDEELFLTSDGGEHWNKSHIDFPDTIFPVLIYDVNLPDEKSIYLLTSGLTQLRNRLYYSHDFGSTWYFYDIDEPVSFKMEFKSETIGWLISIKQDEKQSGVYRDIIKFTSDAGRNWINQLDTISVENKYGLLGIKFYDSLNGIAYGPYNKLWKTFDGGRSWNRDTITNNKNLNDYLIDITFTSNRNFMGVTAHESAFIYKYSETTSFATYGSLLINQNGFIPIFPNPATDIIEVAVPPTIKRGLGDVSEGVRIFNVYGQELPPRLTASATPREGNLKIDVSAFPPGIYFVRVGDKVMKFLKI